MDTTMRHVHSTSRRAIPCPLPASGSSDLCPAAPAILGAGTASATLCKVNESPCAAENQYPEDTTIIAHSNNAILKSNGFSGTTVECKSTATMLHEKIEGGILKGKVTSLLWEECKGCTKATTTTLPTFDDQATGGGNGTVTFLNAVVVLEGCPLGAKCTASAKEATMSLTGGAFPGTAKGTANNIPVVMSGIGCGNEGTWNAGGGSGGEPYFLTEVNKLTSGSIFLE